MKKENKLKHLAIILDGNGRWATKRKLPRFKGHYEGGKRVKEIAIAASQRGVERLTVYAFSTENWKRPEKEVQFIFKLPKEFMRLYLKEIMKYKIRIEYVGDLDKLPDYALKSVRDSIELTKNNNEMVLCFALNYGFYNEMELCIKKIAQKAINNDITIDDINVDLIEDNLMTKMPVDLLIRTSGEMRISNFLMWQIAYSELYFTKVDWPDFSVENLDLAIDEYYSRNRKYGGIQDEE